MSGSPPPLWFEGRVGLRPSAYAPESIHRWFAQDDSQLSPMISRSIGGYGAFCVGETHVELERELLHHLRDGPPI
jgi:hypothetical protein